MTTLQNCEHCGLFVRPSTEGDCPACGQRLRGAETLSALAADAAATVESHSGQSEQFEIVLSGQMVGGDPTIPPLPTKPLRTIVGYCLLVLFAGFVAGLLIAPFVYQYGRPSILRAAAIADMFVLLLVALAISKTQYKQRVAQVLALRAPFVWHSVTVVALALPMLIALTKVLDWLSLLQGAATCAGAKILPTDNPLSFQYVNQAIVALSDFPLPIVLVVGCLLPALGEEIFFRGLLGRILLGRCGRVGGILLTSLLFGVMHMNLPQACYTFLFGIILHWVYLTTRSLWLPILLHAINNFFAFTLYKLELGDVMHFTHLDGASHVPPLLLAAALLTSALLLGCLWQTQAFVLDRRGKRWSPGYATAELPPAEIGAKLERRKATLPLALGGTCAFFLLVVAVMHTTTSWSALTYAHRATKWWEAGEIDKAQAAVAEARRLDPSLPWPLTLEALLAVDRGEPDKALELTQLALDQRPKGQLAAWAYEIRGRSCLDLGDFQGSVRECSHSIELEPSSPTAWIHRATAYSHLEEFKLCLADCDEAIRLEPQSSDALRVRAYTLVESGEYERAIDDCDQALERMPADLVAESAFVYGTRGRAKAALGQVADAIGDFTTALDTADGEVWLFCERARLYHQQEDYAQAIADFNAAVRLTPEDFTLHYRRAQSYAASEQWKLAIADFTLSIDAFPGDASLYDERATAYEQQGDAELAASDRQVAGALRAGGAVRDGIYEFSQGRMEAAVALFTSAVELDSKSIDAHMWRAQALINLQQPELAVADYTAALALDADRSEALLGRGRVLLARKEFTAAIDDLTRYLKSPMADPAAFLDRAAALRALGREADAAHDEQHFAELTGAHVVER